ncbi:hypothetical protein Ahy_A10g050697 isoform B [Arachis hypogaea]|uniref:Uncharacterized protein n=1 Tax=Arachis hypogaea TaxID=3818 RepID=A0A445BA41_ARAHY|nr:hypothetical protein Ahy_A10g050697 isoform B [Arachis hypogaea]
MQHIRSDKAKNLGSSGLKFKEGNQGGFWGEEDITHYIHGSSGGDPKLEGSLTWQAGRPPSVTSGRVSVPLISSEAPLISDLPLSLCHFRGVKRCLETYRDQDRLPIGVGIRRLLLDTGIAGGAEKTEVDLLIHPTLIAGEKVALFHQEATEAVPQLRGAIEVDLQPRNDIEDIEAGVLRYLLFTSYLNFVSTGLSEGRRQQEAELKLIEEETAKRVEEAIRKRVEESLNSEEVQVEIQRRLEEGRKRLNVEVTAQLEKEKEAAVIEAKRKEEQARKEKEELERILEENKRKTEEAQRREALEQQRREEERYRELEELQRQKEEAMRRKKQEEEQERLNQIKLLGKNKSRPKLSFALGSK